MPVHHVSKLTSVSGYKLWTLLDLYINAARFDEDYSERHSIGMDEPSAALHIGKTFQQLYALPDMEGFEAQLQKWYFWATHSKDRKNDGVSTDG